MKKIAVLFSGGVESSLLLNYYLKRGYIVYPFYVRCGFSWERVEIRWASRLWSLLKKRHPSLMTMRILSARWLWQRDTTPPSSEGDLEIPLRNMTLSLCVLLGASSRGVATIAIGSLGIYPFPDNRREFFDSLEELVSSSSRRGIKIETPFMGLQKGEVITRHGKDFPLYLTFSCASPVGNSHCGVCAKCMERKEGFREAGLPDRTPYFFKNS